MPDNAGPTRTPVFSRRLIKIMTVMERARIEMEQKGHQPFAEALRACAQEIIGGNMDCPLGKLVVDESARTGKFMASDLMPKPPSPSDAEPAKNRLASIINIKPTSADLMEWRNKHARMWGLLKEDARLAGDKDCQEALEACNDLTQTHRCPVRELILQGMWHADKS